MKGWLWFSEKIFPWAAIIFFITIAIDIIVLLPLSIIRKTREIGLVGLLISSYLFGLLIWVWSFLIVYSIWGWIGLTIGLMIAGIGVAPVAILALILNAQWAVLLELIILLAITFGMRIVVFYAAERNDNYYEE